MFYDYDYDYECLEMCLLCSPDWLIHSAPVALPMALYKYLCDYDYDYECLEMCLLCLCVEVICRTMSHLKQLCNTMLSSTAFSVLCSACRIRRSTFCRPSYSLLIKSRKSWRVFDHVAVCLSVCLLVSDVSACVSPRSALSYCFCCTEWHVSTDTAGYSTV